MIIEEPYGDGLVRHYSDAGLMMLQVETGVKYGDAIDVVPCRYTYEETDEPSGIEPVNDEFGDELSAEEALGIILGGAR